jgi:membrane peptidoglycan carboxypeptidase
MYNKNMFGSRKIQIQRQRAYLRRQRLLAKKHRKYMRFRDIKTIHHIGEERSQKKLSLLTLLFIATKNSIVSILFALKDFLIGVPTYLSLFFMDVNYALKSLIYPIKNKISESTKNTSKITTNNIMNKNIQQKQNSTRPVRVSPHSKTQKKKKTIWSRVRFVIISVFVLALIIAGLAFTWFLTLEIPSVQNFENRKISNSTKIFDKTGEVMLYDIHENIRRTVVDLEDIAQSSKDAIVAIEDHTFYEHNGVVWRSTFRAVVQTLMSKIGLSNRGTAGGSTLTQQVVKNTLLNKDKRVTRKVKEWVLAMKIERRLGKNEILEIYLNEAPYGGTVYGIQEASKRFFGVAASEVSVAQSAYLAAIPNLPTFYSPYGPNKDALDERQSTVLREMKRYSFISDVQYREALREEVIFLPEEDNFAKSLHFVQYIRAQLEETYGVDMVQNGGLQVTTSLDYELQQKAEQIIKEHVEEVEEPYDASNAGLVAIESTTGHILTMVGSRDYFDTEEFDGNFNVALAERQPGSAFKPIAYAEVFEKGYFPESSIFDVETQFNSRCEADDTTSENGCYSPNNYDFKFNGPITFRNALAQSRNIPAIKISYLAGVGNVIKKARNLGITSLTQAANYYGLGLVLGGGEVSLLQMTSAYSAFSNDGVYNKPTGILEIKDLSGNILEKYVSNEERVVEKNAARMLNSVLSDNVARAPLFGSQSFLYFGEKSVAGKTGTTNDNRDAWLIGYTPDVAVGVWTGNNDNSPMKKGSTISGKPWRKFMDEVMKNYDNRSFGEYELPSDFQTLPNMIRGDWYGGTTVYIDSISGKLATKFTPEETKIAIPQPEPHTILHWINKSNPIILDDDRDDPQYKNWEFAVADYTQRKLGALLNIKINLPTEFDDVHGEEEEVKEIETFDFDIKGLNEGKVYELGEEIIIEIDNLDIRDRDVSLVQFFINNSFSSSDESTPFEYSFIPEQLQYFEENNILRVIVTSEEGSKSIREISFTLNI